MSVWIYPENYVVPPTPDPVVLSTQQRTAVKTKMKQYLNNGGEPMLIKTLVEDAHAYIMTNYQKHIPIDELVVIALEIRAEYGDPTVVEE